MIEIRKLSVSKKTIAEIDIIFDKRKTTAVIGPNGCGKTTLLRAISGLVKYSGEIIIDGRAHKDYNRVELARKIAYMPQSRHTPDMIVEEYLMCARYPHMSYNKIPSKADLAAVEAAIEQTGIEHLRKRNVKTLSGGERQKVYLAFALAQETDILLLDEPTTFLDIDRQYEMMELIKRANGSKTVIAVLHHVSLALEYADNVIVMNEGRIAFSGAKEDAVSSGVLEQIYGIEINTVEIDGKAEYHITKKKPS